MKRPRPSAASTVSPSVSVEVKTTVKISGAIARRIREINEHLAHYVGTSPIRLGAVARVLAELGVGRALGVLDAFEEEEGYCDGVSNPTAWVVRKAREEIADDEEVEVEEENEPPMEDEDESGCTQNPYLMTDVSNSKSIQQESPELLDALYADSGDSDGEDPVDLPNTFVKHVEQLNSRGTFATPLRLDSCSAALARLHQTRLMFEILRSLPPSAYQSDNPAAWVRRAATAMHEAECQDDPEAKITDKSRAKIDQLNENFAIPIDLAKIGFHLGGLSPNGQSKVLARCEKKSSQNMDDPNPVIIHFSRVMKQFAKGSGKEGRKGKSKGKMNEGKSKGKGRADKRGGKEGVKYQ